MLRRLIALLALAALVVAFALPAFAEDPGAEQTIRDAAARNGANGDLAVKIARCESGLRGDAHNPSGAQGAFQYLHGGTNSVATDADRATAQMASSGTSAWNASRRCWGGGGGSGSRAKGRSAPAAPPTGTDHCDRTSGEWRCVGSYIYPDMLTVTPTIEADQGWQGCGYERIESGEFWIACH